MNVGIDSHEVVFVDTSQGEPGRARAWRPMFMWKERAKMSTRLRRTITQTARAFLPTVAERADEYESRTADVCEWALERGVPLPLSAPSTLAMAMREGLVSMAGRVVIERESLRRGAEDGPLTMRCYAPRLALDIANMTDIITSKAVRAYNAVTSRIVKFASYNPL